MAFYLGSFTGGLFGGYESVDKMFFNHEKLKQLRMETETMEKFNTAGAKVRSEMGVDKSSSPDIKTETTSSSAAGVGSGNIDLNSVPLPDFMKGSTSKKLAQEALTPSGTVPRGAAEFESVPAAQTPSATAADAGRAMSAPAQGPVVATAAIPPPAAATPELSMGARGLNRRGEGVPLSTLLGGWVPQAAPLQPRRPVPAPIPPGSNWPGSAPIAPSTPAPTQRPVVATAAIPPPAVGWLEPPPSTPAMRIPTAQYDEYGNLISY